MITILMNNIMAWLSFTVKIITLFASVFLSVCRKQITNLSEKCSILEKGWKVNKKHYKNETNKFDLLAKFPV